MLTRLTSREWFRGLSNEAKDALTFGFLLTPRLGLAMASNILTQSDTSGRGAVSIQASVSVATSLAGTERESTSISESTSFRGHSGRKEWLPLGRVAGRAGGLVFLRAARGGRSGRTLIAPLWGFANIEACTNGKCMTGDSSSSK